jgi:Uncharacterized protein conserved in bacteria (DUF2252)
MVEDDGVQVADRPIPVLPHPSEADSRAIGKEARAKVPRASHATFEPSAERPDPVTLLEDQATTRVQELVPIRYGRMLVSPFTFFRGAGPLHHTDVGPDGPDLRRRPPVELRCLRVTRAPARLRLQ